MYKQKKIKLLIVVSTLLSGISAHAADIPAIDCMIEPNVMVELSSPVAGVLDTLTVDKSDEVKSGQLVATLKAEVEAVNVQTSEERLKLSRIEHKRAVELYREKAITLSDKDKSENEKKLYELDVKNAKANLDLRQIRSPIDGVIVKRYAMPGEFVETKPILQIAQLDPLRIEVVSPVSNYGKIKKGMQAKILPEFGEYDALIATVVVVDKVIDAASGTFGVRLELENKDYAIPGGLKCQVRFMPELAIVDEVIDVVSANSSNTDENDVAVVSTDKEMMCSSIGPYKEQAVLDGLLADLGAEVAQANLRTHTETVAMYLVVSVGFDSVESVKNTINAMKTDGINDIARLKRRGSTYSISLGLYKRESLAKKRVSDIRKKGYSAEIKTRTSNVNNYWADVTYPHQFIEDINNVIPGSHRAACDEDVKISVLK
jgi:RND family efflux transporter MFP subunit